MSGLGLNLEPNDVDMEDAEFNGSEPFFCTQSAQTKVFDEV
jgi:hypothetical protein